MELVFAYLADDLVMAFSGCGALRPVGLALSGVSADAELAWLVSSVRALSNRRRSPIYRPCVRRWKNPVQRTRWRCGRPSLGITLLPQLRVDLLVLNRRSHTGSPLNDCYLVRDLWFPAPAPFKRSALTTVFPSRSGREH
jgi:hypothetical protein